MNIHEYQAKAILREFGVPVPDGRLSADVAGEGSRSCNNENGGSPMDKSPGSPKYNVVSIRISDEEKAAMEELKRQTHKNVSTLMREALHLYTPRMGITINHGC